MLTYNTQLKKLALPEYGRNIQQMVDHCLTIEDREERTRCAYAIVKVMGNLFPALRENEDGQHKLWDHLAIMSDFKLDIDFPCEVVCAENLATPPMPVPYDQTPSDTRHYGRLLLSMIKRAAEMVPGRERDALITLLANQMKKTMLAGGNNIDDRRIYNDLAVLSRGAIRVDETNCVLHNFTMPVVQGKKKKKK